MSQEDDKCPLCVFVLWKEERESKAAPISGDHPYKGPGYEAQGQREEAGRSQSSQGLGARDSSAAECFQLTANRHFISIEINKVR